MPELLRARRRASGSAIESGLRLLLAPVPGVGQFDWGRSSAPGYPLQLRLTAGGARFEAAVPEDAIGSTRDLIVAVTRARAELCVQAALHAAWSARMRGEGA